jgi:Bacterial Ig-like domain
MRLSFLSKGKNILILFVIFVFFITFFRLQTPVKAKAAVALPLSVSVEQEILQTDPSGNLQAKFIVTFSEPIDKATFDSGDITITGSAPNSRVVNLTEIAPLNATKYEFTTRSDAGGTVIASIPEASYAYTSAKFADTGSYPVGITIDNSGNIYTANLTEASITKINPAGIVTTIATPSGAGNFGIALDQANNIYTSEFGNRGTIKITSSGSANVFGSPVTFQYGIAVDTFDNVYTVGNTVTKTAPSGISTQYGNLNGNPIGIVLDTTGNLYTANYNTNTVSKVAPNGITTTFANTGDRPYGIAYYRNMVYVANSNSTFLTRILADGNSSDFGSLPSGAFDVKVDTSGNVYSANRNGTVSLTNPNGISRIIGTTDTGPIQLVLDPQGNIYTSNEISSTVTKISKTTNLASGIKTLSGKLNLPSTSNDNSVTINEPPAPPPAPGNIHLINGSDTGVNSNDNITYNPTPNVEISCNPGNSIGVYDGDAVLFGDVCPTSGLLSFQITGVLYEGSHSIRVTQFDSYDQFTSAPNPFMIIIDTINPVPPVVLVPPNTQNSTPPITGQCEADQIVKILINPTNEQLNTTCTSTGSFNTTPEIPIPAGNFSVTATQVDTAGNISLSTTTGGVIFQTLDNSDRDGDGLTDVQESTYGTNPDLIDTDGDGSSDFVEFNGPNNGDFNENGVADGIERWVSGVSSQNEDFVGIVSNGGRTCSSISSSTLVQESILSASDTIYKYPKGLIDFKINCSLPGVGSLVDLYFTNQTDSTNLKVRKFINGIYSDVENATKTQTTINGIPTVKVSYSILDGGQLDQDGSVNGEIIDPIGLALLDTPITQSNTLNGTNNTAITTSSIGDSLIRTGGQ